MWTGLASAEGIEYVALAPLAVLLFIGLPCYLFYRLALLVIALIAAP